MKRARYPWLWGALWVWGCAAQAPRVPAPATPSSTERRPTPATAPSERDATHYRDLLLQAKTAADQANLDRALGLIGEAKQLLPAEAGAYLGAGVVLYRAGRVSMAAAEFKRAIELSAGEAEKTQAVDNIGKVTSQPRDPREEALLRTAFDAIEAHHPEQALAPLQQALDLNPANARTRFEIGYAFIDLGRIEEAIAQLEEARRINPVARNVLKELQYCYGERHRYTELGGVVRDRLLVDGESPGLLHELGWSYAVQGNRTVAVATFEDNLRRNPTFYPSHFSVGQLYCDEKREPGKGRAHLQAFLDRGETDLRKPKAEQLVIARSELEVMVREAHQLFETCGR